MLHGKTAALVQPESRNSAKLKPLPLLDPTLPPPGTRPTYLSNISSCAFRSARNASAKAQFENEQELRVVPEQVQIDGYLTGEVRRINLQIQNISNTLKRISILTPRSKYFSLEKGSALDLICIPPGQSYFFTLVFTAPSRPKPGNKLLADAHVVEVNEIFLMDSMTVHSSGSPSVEIPLKALPADSRLEFDPAVDFGTILWCKNELLPFSNSNQDWIVKKVIIRNTGSRSTCITCQYDESLPIHCKPLSMTLGAANQTDIPSEMSFQVAIHPSIVGHFSHIIKLSSQTQPSIVYTSLNKHVAVSVMEIKANVIEHQLSIQNMNSLSHLNAGIEPELSSSGNIFSFGTVYFGQEAYLPVLLKNHASSPVRWILTPSKQNVPTQLDVQNNLCLKERRKEIERKEDKLVNISVFPMEGVIPAKSSAVIKFKFNPTLFRGFYGFKSISKMIELKMFEIGMRLQVIQDTKNIELSPENQIDITITGQGCPIQSSLSKQVLDFRSGESDIIVKVVNESKHLGFKFRFDTIAHFSFSPSYGDVKPGDSCDVTVSFKPHILGNFSQNVHCFISPQILEMERKWDLTRLSLKLIGVMLPKSTFLFT